MPEGCQDTAESILEVKTWVRENKRNMFSEGILRVASCLGNQDRAVRLIRSMGASTESPRLRLAV